MDPVIPPPRLPTIVDLATFLAEHDAEGHHTTVSEATAAALALKADASTLTAHTGATAAHGATGAVVGTTNAQTLTNKTLTTPAISGGNIDRASITVMDSGFSLVDDADNTKIARFIATGLTAATTRSLTIPDKSGTLAMVDDVTTHAALTAAHGATGAVVGTTNTQTLTNKTITYPVLNQKDADFGLFNSTDTSKQGKFSLSGLTPSAPRTWPLPNKDGTLATTGDVALNPFPWETGGRYSNATHGLIGTASSKTLASGVLYAVPIAIPTDTSFTRMAVDVTTAVAASTVRVGLAAWDGTLVKDAGALSAATTGPKETTSFAAVPVAAGRYLLLIGPSAAGIAVKGLANLQFYIADASLTAYACRYVPTWTYGALPATLPATNLDTTSPVVWIGVGL